MRAFVTVSREGTIAAAAEKLRITPSPLSRTIRELERSLGRELFARKYHHFERTPFGEEFLPLAVEMLAQADFAQRFAEVRDQPGLRIGGTPWTSTGLTEQFVEAARTSGADEGFVSDVSAVLIDALRHGDLDVALVHLPIGAPGLRTVPLARYRYAVASATDSGLPDDRPLVLGDLTGRTLLTMPGNMQPAFIGGVLDTLTAAGVESVAEVDLRDLIGLESRMRRTGELMLITVTKDMPQAARFLDIKRMRTHPVADGELISEVGLVSRSGDHLHSEAISRIVSALDAGDGPKEL